MRRGGTAVVVCGGALAVIGSITDSLSATVYGCFLIAVIVWGDR